MRVNMFVKTQNVYSHYTFLGTEKYKWEICVALVKFMWKRSYKDTVTVRVWQEDGRSKYVKIKSEDDLWRICEGSAIKIRGKLLPPFDTKYSFYVEAESDVVAFNVENSYINNFRDDNGNPLLVEAQMHLFDGFMDEIEIFAFSLYAKRRIVWNTLIKLKNFLIECASANEFPSDCEIMGVKFNLDYYLYGLDEFFKKCANGPRVRFTVDLLDTFEDICSPGKDDEEDAYENDSDV